MSSETAFERFIAALEADGRAVKHEGQQRVRSQCPAHTSQTETSRPLAVKGIEDRTLIKCFGGCSPEDVLAALGMTMADLFDTRSGATYNYPDGRRVHRSTVKDFLQSGYTKGSSLFRADKVTVNTDTVYVVEGEQDVLAIESIGGVAVSSAGGAGNAHKADWTPLHGKDVTIVADKDKAGKKHALQVVSLLEAVKPASVCVVEAKTGKDAADHITAGHGLDDFVGVDWWPLDDTEANEQPTAEAKDAAMFFGREGLLALDLANEVMRLVPCGFNTTSKMFYVYSSGVWAPGSDPIEAAVTTILGNRYRNSHCRNVLDLIRFSPNVADITCDPVPRYINVPNGMVDWKTGELLPHSPDYLSTVQLPVHYDPGAACPEFDKFLAQVLPDDCIEFIWEVIGYAMYSGNPLQIAILLHGIGRNGKGTLIRVLSALLGKRNCSAVGLHELTENRFRTATLYGKLANLAGDLDSKWIENTAAFKAITGGDVVQAESKYGAPFDFTPWALPIYSANRPFGSADSSEGWVARWTIIPFPQDFLGKEDRGLDARLQADGELRGIMRKGIAALPALMKRGRMLTPDSVAKAKAAFVVASDTVRSWIDEACVIDADAWTNRTQIYNAYKQHAFLEGAKPLSANGFYNRAVQIRGVRNAKRQGENGLSGIRLRTPADAVHDDDDDEQGGRRGSSPTPSRAHTGERVGGASPSSPSPGNSQVDGESRGEGESACRTNGSTAYVNGMCRDCGVRPYSAGRTRCEQCHRTWLTVSAGYDR